MKPLKICIFTETYYPVIGGGETQARLLAEGLAKKGCSVIILTRRSDPTLARSELYGVIKVYRLPPAGPQHLKKWGLLLSSIPALFRLRKQYDLILVSGFRVIGVTALIVGSVLNKVCLLKADSTGEMSGEFFYGGMGKMGWKPGSRIFKLLLSLRNQILRRADGFIAISSQVSDEYLEHGIMPHAVSQIPNSVSPGLFHPVKSPEKFALRKKLKLPEEEILVIFTGRLVSYKGLPGLVRVWSQLIRKHINVVLLLVGGGSLDIHNCEAQLKEYVIANGLEKSVLFCGEVHNVHEYLQAADIFVFPTEKEAFGIALVEAMACGLPVIATPIGGSKDFLLHDKNGLVVKPGDDQELLLALEYLISNRAKANALGLAAWHTVQSRYAVEVVTEQYLNLFSSLIQGPVIQ